MWLKGKIIQQMYPTLRQEIARSPFTPVEIETMMGFKENEFLDKMSGLVPWTGEEMIKLRNLIGAQDMELEVLFAKRK